MRIVKPREVFNLLDGDPYPFVTLKMPLGPFGDEEGEGITLLETFLLIAISRKIQAQTIFEFGTHRGRTAQALAMNVPTKAKRLLATIDAVEYPEAVANCAHLPIRRHVCNTLEFIPPPCYLKGFDIVWIDAGHEPGPFWSDTRLGRELLRPGGVMVWHDCGSPSAAPAKWPNVEEWLETNTEAVRIASTTLAVEGLF